jgi:hypothetical protein
VRTTEDLLRTLEEVAVVRNPQSVRNPQLVRISELWQFGPLPQSAVDNAILAANSPTHYYSEGDNRTRGDLRQLAATLNNPLKRSPGAYARAFLLSPAKGRGELKLYDR